MNLIYNLADGGAFNKAGYSPIESAMLSDLYEALGWLQREKLKNEK